MTLFTSQGQCSSGETAQAPNRNAWVEAAEQLRAEGWPIACVEVLPAGSSTTGSGSTSSGDARGWHVRAIDVGGAWKRLHPGAARAAVLARPDGHVAWRELEGGRGSSSGADGGGAGGRVARLRAVLAELGWRPAARPAGQQQGAAEAA